MHRKQLSEYTIVLMVAVLLALAFCPLPADTVIDTRVVLAIVAIVSLFTLIATHNMPDGDIV